MDYEKLLFVQRNIVRLNEPKVRNFLVEEGDRNPFPNETELGYFLLEKFQKEIKHKFELVWNIWSSSNFKKNKITEIANQFFWNKSDLEKYLRHEVKQKVLNRYSMDQFSGLFEGVVENITNQCEDIGFKFIRTEFVNVFKNSFHITLQCGFPVNNYNVNSGVMIANAGDSAQFLFLARAILIGLNCSNVDVRSSRYDAIVDYKNKLFRIQVKGVSGTSISFKDRDRGGQGIDSNHERNKGKRVTSKDCDVYVAVDKTIGICYLIPMYWVESLDEDEINSISLSSVSHYREYWKVFDDLVEM
jgi:hypothetical protein